MKKLMVMLVAVLAVAGLCACGSVADTKANFSEEDLVFTNSDDEIELELNQSIYIWDDYTVVEEHSDYSYEEFEADYKTARGLALGDGIKEYKDLYFKSNSYAVWELCDSQDYTEFAKYTGQSAADMVGEDYATWLDVGYYLEDGKWKKLSDTEVRDVWFCDADLDDYDEVVIISVHFNDFDEIECISVNYFEYDDGFVEYQGWIE